MNVPLRVLIIDDSENDVKLMLRELVYGGYDPTYDRVDTPTAMAAALEREKWDVVITDCVMPHFSAQAVLALLKEKRMHLPVVVVSGKIAEDVAAACIQAGAQDFVMKGQKGHLVAAVERAMVRHVEASSSNAELIQFARTASGDLLEPLQMVAEASVFLAQRTRGSLDAEGQRAIASIQEGIQRIRKFVEGLVEYAQVGAEGESPQSMDCSGVVDRALAELKGMVEETGAVVTTDNLPTVVADPSQLALLFRHLISNAIKFRREERPRVHISSESKQNKWIFSVRDNGAGMDLQQEGRLFGIFQRLHTKMTYPGVGIGLAVCRKIVERHGGRIWFESRPGTGSTVFFTLPLFIPTAAPKRESFKLSR